MYAQTHSHRVACLQPWILVVWRLLWRINTAVKKRADWSSVMVSSTHSKSAFSEPEPTHLPTHTDAGPSLNYIYTRTNTVYTVGSLSMSGFEPNRMRGETCELRVRFSICHSLFHEHFQPVRVPKTCELE